MLNIQSLFLNFSDVGKTFSQLLFGASLSARDVLCSSMLEISILRVISKIFQLFFGKYLCHILHIFCVKFF